MVEQSTAMSEENNNNMIEKIEQDVERDLLDRRKDKLTSLFNMIGGVSGLLSIGAILVWGGEIKKQTEINTRDIRDLQVAGSVALQTHVAADSKESAIMSDRILNISRLVEKQVELSTALIQQTGKLMDMIKWQNQVRQP
jgi:hypothetical protein